MVLGTAAYTAPWKQLRERQLGNVLLVAWELRSLEEAVQAGRQVVDDAIKTTYIAEVEPVGPTGGNVVWEWRVFDHLVHHAARQRRHKDHGPDANRDSAHHDQGAPMVAPEIAPGQAEHRERGQYAAGGHQAALIASTGCSLCRRSAG